MKKESFFAGYSFVKIVRAFAYVILLLGLAGASIWGVVRIIATTAAIGPISKAYSKATELIEKEQQNLKAMKQRFAKEEKDFVDGHDKRVLNAREELRLTVESFNREVSVALAEVKKVSPLSINYDFDALDIPKLDTKEDCEQYLLDVKNKMQQLESLQQEMYKSINVGLAKLVSPVQEKKQSILSEIEEQQQQIAKLEQEIKKIYSSYRVTQKVTTIIPRKKELMNKAPLYEADSNEGNRINVGMSLPGVVSVVVGNEYVDSKNVEEFRSYVARLVGWLPYLRESQDMKKEHTHEEVDPNPDLTDEDESRIEKLRERIAKCREEIMLLENKIYPLDTQLDVLNTVKKGIDSSRESVLSDWSVMSLSPPVLASAQSIKQEIVDFPDDLKNMMEGHAQDLSKVEERIANLVSKRDASWSSGCSKLGYNLIIFGVCGSLIAIVVSWCVWAAILVLMDFAVSPLIIAMRAQDIQYLLEKTTKN